MNFATATTQYESWLAAQVRLVRGDLLHKHVSMGASPFSFLRATYYRWAQQFAGLDRSISKAPKVLGVGDLHMENFGTWRDGLGRLAWGINDFDEAFVLPYTNDLVRLAASAMLAIEEDGLHLSIKAACRSILDGYREGIASGGRPFIIGDEHRWFKPILQNPQRDPGLFWDRLRNLPLERSPVPAQARRAIESVLPAKQLPYAVHHRVAGLGNLGKARYTAIAPWHGGPVAREAKVVTLSAAGWASGRSAGPFYEQVLTNAVRSPDPYLKVHDRWLVRRLAPDCRRLEISSLRSVEDEEWLLRAMGFEAANVHAGSARAVVSIRKHLKDFSKKALRKAAGKMQQMLMTDYRQWNQSRAPSR